MGRLLAGITLGATLTVYLERAWWARRLINWIFTTDTRERRCRTHRRRSSSA